MNRNTGLGLLGGVALGAAAMLAIGAEPASDLPPHLSALVNNNEKTIEEVYFPGRRQGTVIVGEGIIFSPERAELEELPPLGDPRIDGPGRYEILALSTPATVDINIHGDKTEPTTATTGAAPASDFLVLDTHTGIVTRFSPGTDDLRLYNVRTPNQVLRARLTERFIDTGN